MKNIFRISSVTLLILSIFLINSCKKDKPALPIITTTVVTEISQTIATSGGNVINEGGAPLVSMGVCWNTSANPTITNNKTTETGRLGTFTSNITLLTPNTIYYVRAYATNIAGTGYGVPMSFTTLSTSGIDKIISFSYIRPGGYYYYEEGFSFFLAKNATTLNNPGPDIVLYVYIPNIDVSINSLILHTASSVNSFYKFGDYPDVAAAITAFNNLKNVGIFQWKEIADPINANQVWVYRRSTGNYAKIRIISMVNEKRAGTPYGVYGECIFEWLYQPDGSLTFPIK